MKLNKKSVYAIIQNKNGGDNKRILVNPIEMEIKQWCIKSTIESIIILSKELSVSVCPFYQVDGIPY